MALLPNYLFNEDLYNGGLLGNLPMWASQPGTSQGFPQPQGAPQQGLGFLGELSNALANNAGLLMALGGGLASGGIGAGLKAGAAYELGSQKKGMTSDIQEYEYARRQGLQGSFIDFLKAKRAAGGEYGLNPVWGVDAQGNPVAVQLGKTGVSTQAQLPPGVRISKEPIKFDAGTHYVLMDPITRQTIGIIPKELRQAEREKAAGKETGAAQTKQAFAKPADVFQTGNVLNEISGLRQAVSDIRGDPAIERITGVYGAFSNWPGGAAANMQVKRDRVVNVLAVRALNAMREASKTGGAVGQVTEREWPILQQQIATLAQTQDAGQFNQQLGVIIDYVNGLEDRIKRRYKETYGEEFKAESQTTQTPPSPSKPSQSDPLGIR